VPPGPAGQSHDGDLLGEFQQLLLSAAPGEPPVCSRATLRELPPGEVLVARAVIAGAEVRHAPSTRLAFLFPRGLSRLVWLRDCAVRRRAQPRYYRLMMPDAEVVTCNACARFFAQEDFEMEYLKAPAPPAPASRCTASKVSRFSDVSLLRYLS